MRKIQGFAVIPRKTRIRILRKMAQIAGAPGPVPAPAQEVNIRSVPGFKANLFAAAPHSIDDLNLLINKINRYMLMLGDKKTGFNEVWMNPSVSGSNFNNSLKNLFNLSKWIYRIFIVDRAPYTVQDLKKIYSDIISSLNYYSFPEPVMANTKNDLMMTAKQALANLGQ